MKKTILSSLLVLLTLAIAIPVMAQEADSAKTAPLSRIQQFKQYADVNVNNTANGIVITVTGTTFNYDQKLVNLYFEQLFKRSWDAKGRINVTVSQIANGFQINVEGTQTKYVEKIQHRAEQLNLPAKVNNLLLQFLTSHGIK